MVDSEISLPLVSSSCMIEDSSMIVFEVISDLSNAQRV